MFSTGDFNYATKFVAGLGHYLNRTLPLNYTVTDLSTFMSLLNLTDNLLSLAPNVEDVPRFDSLLSGLYARIFNANVNLTNDIRNIIFSYLSDILADTVGLAGFDPSVFLTNFAGDQNFANAAFGSATLPSNKNSDLTLTVVAAANNLRVLFAKEIYTRFLASGVKQSTSVVNMASPSVVITKDVSASLPTNAKFQLSFVRDPRAYNKPGQTVINSQIVSLAAKGQGNATYVFPTGATPINITVPWVYVPFSLANGTTYQQSCVVNSYTNNTWNTSATCKISANSNTNNSYVVCSEFSTIGVSCKNARLDPSIFITKNTTNSAFFSVASALIALVAFLLF
jgi:hypothetical protein